MGGCDDHQRFFASLVKRKRREWAILTSRKKKTGLICWEFLFDKQKAEFWADGGVVIIIVVVIVLIVVAVVIVATVAVVVVAVVLIVVGCNLFALSLEKWLLTYSLGRWWGIAICRNGIGLRRNYYFASKITIWVFELIDWLGGCHSCIRFRSSSV